LGCIGCIGCIGCGSRGGLPARLDRPAPLPALRHVDPPLAAMLARARERMDVLREDLARAAWHPSRVRSWCLAHDDLFFGDAGGASPPADPRE